ncbi:hypothetical protein JCM11491_005374 [Sporobolomyces phaffii]
MFRPTPTSVSFLMIPILTLTPPTPLPSPDPSRSPTFESHLVASGYSSQRGHTWANDEPQWTPGTLGGGPKFPVIGCRADQDPARVAADVTAVVESCLLAEGRRRERPLRTDKPFANLERVRTANGDGDDGRTRTGSDGKQWRKAGKASRKAKKVQELVRVDNKLHEALSGFGW